MESSYEAQRAVPAEVPGADFEQAFREFCALPENAKLVEKSQRSEMRKIRRNAEQAAAIRFRDVVLASPPEAQRNIAPYLAIPVLRRVVQTMTNDEQGDFGRWACNPLVLSMLRETRQALADGRMTEAEVERLLIAQAKARAALRGGAARDSESLLTSSPAPAHQDEKLDATVAAQFKAVTRPKARLDSTQLVSALNEQLRERFAGNALYRAGRLEEAAECYAKARAILNLVSATNAEDEAELDKNRTAVLGNLAAVAFAQAQYGECALRCTEALALEPDSVKLLLRRARARAARGDFALAEEDLGRVKDIEPWNAEAEEQEGAVKAARRAAQADAARFSEAALRSAGSR